MLIVNNANFAPKMRVFSVLGYFAAANLIIGLVNALLPPLSPPTETQPETLVAAFYEDTGRYVKQWGAMGLLGVVYLCLTFLLPVPGEEEKRIPHHYSLYKGQSLSRFP